MVGMCMGSSTALIPAVSLVLPFIVKERTKFAWIDCPSAVFITTLFTDTEIHYKQEQSQITQIEKGKREQAPKNQAQQRGITERGQGKRRQTKEEEVRWGGSIGKRNRKRKGICRARAIPSKGSTRNTLRQKTHNRCLGNSLTDEYRDLSIANGSKLRKLGGRRCRRAS